MAHVAAPASNTSNLAPRHVASTSASSSASPCSPSLEEENAALRTQLQLEQLQSAALKVRLGALETKFARLDELLRGDSAAVAVALPPLHTPPTTTTATFTPSHLSPLPALPTLSPLPPSSSDLNRSEPEEEGAVVVEPDAQDSLRLVAREVDSSLPRKLSHPSRSSPPPPLPSTLPSSRPSTTPRPSLHQILSSISIPNLSSTTTPSATRGTNGPSGWNSTREEGKKLSPVVVRLSGAARSSATMVGSRRRRGSLAATLSTTTTEDCSRGFRRRRFLLFRR